MWCASHRSHDVCTTEEAVNCITAAVQRHSRHHRWRRHTAAAAAAANDLITSWWTLSQIFVRVRAVNQTVGQCPAGRHRDASKSMQINVNSQTTSTVCRHCVLQYSLQVQLFDAYITSCDNVTVYRILFVYYLQSSIQKYSYNAALVYRLCLTTVPYAQDSTNTASITVEPQ